MQKPPRNGGPASRRRTPVSQRRSAAPKKSDLALRQKEQYCRLLVEHANEAMFVVHNGWIIDCNRKALALFRCTRRQILQELDPLLPRCTDGTHNTIERARDLMQQALKGRQVSFCWHSRRWKGPPFEMACSVKRVKIRGEAYLLAIAEDLTERRRTERELSRLTGQLLQAQDEERRRIARELHDTTGQNLGALQISLSIMAATAQRLDSRFREAIEDSLSLAQICVREVRTMSYLLHPPLLDELGLTPALRAYAQGYAERTGLCLDLDLPLGMPRLPQAIETTLFRIVQEGLTNIHRHSRSPSVLLRLKLGPGSVILELMDRGRGLPEGMLSAGEPLPPQIGVGIAGMRERARQLGGHLSIASGAGGTTLHVVLPIPGLKATSATT